MSDYRKVASIRLPFPKEVLEIVGTDDPFDCEDYLKERFGAENWDQFMKGHDYFCIEVTDADKYYLDYVIKVSDGEGDYALAWYLEKDDFEKYMPLFDKGGFSYDMDDLRKVAYCWYTCSEPPECYSPEKTQQQFFI